MREINVEAEARQVLEDRKDESRAELIERTAKAIFQADVFGPGGALAADLTKLWHAELATNRIRYRNQARAALAASDLLKRVEELEQRIDTAKRELTAGAPGPLGGEETLGRRASRAYWALMGKPIE